MELIHSPIELQKRMIKARENGQRIGCVPTMGALHEGHISLACSIRDRVDILVMTIFVNPLQFAPSEDLDKYPRTLEADCQKAENSGVDIVFAPSPRDMYPSGFASTVSCGEITTYLEGAARPGHFDGVTTVVLKLFNLVQPHIAVFGQKDAQQSLVIQRMITDLNIPIEMIVHPTVRESDGLAMSSRNTYLTREERVDAPRINRGLVAAKNLYEKGERNSDSLRLAVAEIYKESNQFTPEYISLADQFCIECEGTITGKVLLSVVCRCNSSQTRLIDNIFLG